MSFIPPYNPTFGCLWESGVKSTKNRLWVTFGNSLFTYEELITIITKIEACLNSRPLYAESLDPNDIEALTPGHFLIGQALTILFLEDVIIDVPENRLKYWEMVLHSVDKFWKLWSNDYLNTLHQRYKWRIKENNLKIGEIVLIKKQNLPPSNWPLGKIVEMHPGDDNLRSIYG